MLAAVSFDEPSGVACLELRSPETRNVLSEGMLEDLLSCVATLRAVEGLRALVISAAGRDFCLGGDPLELGTASRLPTEEALALVTRQTTRLARFVSALYDLPVPIVAAINGQAAGAGFALALLADIRVMGKNAKLNFAYSSLGLSTDAGMSWLLRRHVGEARALRLLLNQPVIRAQEALEMGLADLVCDRGNELDTALAHAAQIASRPMHGCLVAVSLLRREALDALKTSIDEEHQRFIAGFGLPDARNRLAGLASGF